MWCHTPVRENHTNVVQLTTGTTVFGWASSCEPPGATSVFGSMSMGRNAFNRARLAVQFARRMMGTPSVPSQLMSTSPIATPRS